MVNSPGRPPPHTVTVGGDSSAICTVQRDVPSSRSKLRVAAASAMELRFTDARKGGMRARSGVAQLPAHVHSGVGASIPSGVQTSR